MELLNETLDDTINSIENYVNRNKHPEIEFIREIAVMVINNTYKHLPKECKSAKSCILVLWESTLKSEANSVRVGMTKQKKTLSDTWIKLFKLTNKLMRFLYPNENSFVTYIIELRNLLKIPKLPKDIFKISEKYMGLTEEESNRRRNDYNKKIQIKNATRNTLIPIYTDQVIDLINKLINSTNISEIALAVALATVRRAIEIYKVSTFEEIPNDNTKIKISGLAKSGPKTKKENSVIVNIIALKSNQVIEAIKKIRDSLGDISNLPNQSLKNRFNSKINNSFKKNVVPIFESNGELPENKNKKMIEKLSFHKARYISGNTSYKLFGEPKEIPESTYLQSQFGHKCAQSTCTYLSIVVKVRNNPKPKPKNNTLMSLSDRFESNNLQSELKEVNPPNIKDLVNKRTKFIPEEDKIRDILEAYKRYKDAGIVIKSNDLKKILKYGSAIMVKANKIRRSK